MVRRVPGLGKGSAYRYLSRKRLDAGVRTGIYHHGAGKWLSLVFLRFCP